jgi:ribosomal protein S30
MAFWHRWFGTPDKDEFARMLMAEIRRAGVTQKLEYDPDEFKITVGEGETLHFLSIGNAYDEYQRAARATRGKILGRWARLSLPRQTPKSFADIRPNLLPRIRDRSQYDRITMQLKLQGMTPPAYAYRVIAEHLALGLVHDMPESVAEMPKDQFETWGVPLDEAFAIATENLDRMSQRPFEKIAAGIYLSPYRDNHDAGRLMLTSQIRRLSVRGSPVAMVPNRDTLIVTGADDPGGLGLMAKITEAALEEPRPISGIPVWLDEDTWRPFVPDEDHPMFVPFGRLRVMSLASDYSAQKQLLDALHGKSDEDLFVASFTVIEHTESGQLSSYCTWTRDVTTLLPHTDLVVLVDPDAPDEPVLARVDWADVARVVGSRMEQVEMYPPRYRVNSFPTAEEIAELKKA